MKRLTPKQQKFCEAYQGAAEGVGWRAAQIAGYRGNENTLRSIASQNLTKLNVKAVLAELSKDDALVASREDRQRFWTRVMAKGEKDPELLNQALKASELLGKTQGDFIQKVEHSGPEGGPLQVQTYTISVPVKEVE